MLGYDAFDEEVVIDYCDSFLVLPRLLIDTDVCKCIAVLFEPSILSLFSYYIQYQKYQHIQPFQLFVVLFDPRL